MFEPVLYRLQNSLPKDVLNQKILRLVRFLYFFGDGNKNVDVDIILTTHWTIEFYPLTYPVFRFKILGKQVLRVWIG